MRTESAVAECGLEKGEGALRLYARALMLFGSTKLDYIDCLLLAGFTSAGNGFISFGRKLMNRKRLTR